MSLLHQFLILMIFISIGIIGMLAHWFKKRYGDHTICCGLFDYMNNNSSATMNALYLLVSSEFGLVAMHSTGWDFTFQEIGLVFMAGYGSDSTLNRAAESDKT